MTVELQHGTGDPDTNITNDDLVATGKIALAHLNEIPDYYTRLAPCTLKPAARTSETLCLPLSVPADRTTGSLESRRAGCRDVPQPPVRRRGLRHGTGPKGRAQPRGW